MQSEREEFHLAFSSDDRYIAAASGNNFVVLNAETDELFWPNDKHAQPIQGVAWMTGQQWKNQIPGLPLTAPLNWAYNRWLTYQEPRPLLLTWSGDNTARLWDVETKTELIRMSQSYPGDARPINVADILAGADSVPSAPLIVTGGYDGYIYIWRTWQDNPEALLTAAQERIAHRN